MDTLINVTFPVFAIIGVGFLSGYWRVLGPESAAALNRFVYYFALPPVLFVFTARAPIDNVLNWPFIAAFMGGGFVTLAIAAVAGRLVFRHDAATLSLHGLSAIFANTAFLGIPLFLTAFGEDGILPAIVGTLFATSILIGGTIAVLEVARAQGPSVRQIAGEAGGVLIRNPLLIASALGVLFSLLAIPLPRPVGNFLDLMAAAAGPAALFALGLSLVGQPLRGQIGEVSWLVVLKLLVHPAATWLLVVYVFPMDPLWAKAAILLASLPAGALVFIIAQQYDVYVQRASASIVASTVLSVATVSALMILLNVG